MKVLKEGENMNNKLVITLGILIMTVVSLVIIKVLPDYLETREQNKETPKQVAPQETKETYVAPFTGMESDTPFVHRPIVATISNDPKARPQSGLGVADYTYEFLIEGAGTRFVAIYQSTFPEKFGPMRSARHYFLPIPQELDAFYVAHGYSPYALSILKSGTVDHINGIQHDGTFFRRSTDRKAPHNSYITFDKVEEAMEERNVTLESTTIPTLSFHKGIDDDIMTTPAISFHVNSYRAASYRAQYTYDETSHLYTRATNGTQMTDALTDEPLTYANVLVVSAPYTMKDSEGRRDLILTEGTRAYLFQQGKRIDVDWVFQDGFVQPVIDGKKIPFVPGRTLVHVIPSEVGLEGAVTFEE